MSHKEETSGRKGTERKTVRSFSVDIGEKNVIDWNALRRRLNFVSDADFVEYLLLIAEKYLSFKSVISNNDDRRRGKEEFIVTDSEKKESSEEDVDVISHRELEDDNRTEIKLKNKGRGEVTISAHDFEGQMKIGEESRNGFEETDQVRSDLGKTRNIRKKKFRAKKKRKVEVENQPSNNPRLEVTTAIGQTEENQPAQPGGGAKVCQYCDTDHPVDVCPLNRPFATISDSCVLSSKTQTDNATASLPDALEMRERDAKGTMGIFARVHISKYTQFGPLVGTNIKEMEIADDSSMKHIWEVCEGTYLSTMDPEKSNWIRWLYPAPTRHDRNVVPFEREGKLYFITTVPIETGSEIFFWAEMNGPWASKKMEKTSCGGCNLKFEHPMYYRTHCAVFHDASLSLTVRKYHCKVCGKAVLGKQNIMKHALLYHDGKGAYQCQFCSKFFLRLNYLEMHRNYGCSANPHRARPLCDYCGRKFCQPQKLKVHIKRMHSDLADVLHEFQCRDCLKILGSRAALQRHTKEVHKRPSGVSCSKCSKTFQNKSNLKIHMLTHSGVKPFQCQEGRCSAAFTTKQCLQFHYKKVHGLSEDRFPSIVRSVEYTFESYAGVRDVGSDNKDTDDTNDSFRLQMDNEGESSVDDNRSSQLNVVDCDDDTNPSPEPTYEETSVIEYHSSATSLIKEKGIIETNESESISHASRENPVGVIMNGQLSSASLLVEAALVSAERELCRSLPAPNPPPPPLPPSNSPTPETVMPLYGDMRRAATPPAAPHYVSVMYDGVKPSTPPIPSTHQVTYLSPRCEQHYLSPSLPHEFVHEEHRYHEEEMAQNLTKFKCEGARTMYHELIPRYPISSADYYPWDVLRPGLSLQTSIDLSVSTGHLPLSMDPPSPPYPAFHVPQKSPGYNHYPNYY